jgi:hypothetical protein
VHGIATASPSSWCVYQFRHLGKLPTTGIKEGCDPGQASVLVYPRGETGQAATWFAKYESFLAPQDAVGENIDAFGGQLLLAEC